MPLVERYNDWQIADRSFDDPNTLEFDHRIEADASSIGTGLANIEDNMKATCVITSLKPEFGWTQIGNGWSYDPTQKETDLCSIWRRNLSDCIQHDKDSLKDCFCSVDTNPATAYSGPKAESLPGKIDALEWPSDATEFVSRFTPAGQYMIGPKFCSAYHLGDGYVGTAGHCLDKALIDCELGGLRVIFNWLGDVVSKKIFTENEVFRIERVVLCDSHGPVPSPSDPVKTAPWTRRWDSAILKLKGTPRRFSHLKSAKYAAKPPEFGKPVYNIGCPLGVQLKVAARAHVLRHSLVGDEENPFSHLVAGYGTFTTDLDQFEGNSGGPVFDANTGYIVGHTSSTQDAVAEGDAAAIEGWADEFATTSKNHALAIEINTLLKNKELTDKFYRVHPKFLRTLSGRPRDNPLIKCATTVCPGDLGPNRVMQAPGRYQAVLSRHHFGSKDVYFRNATARVDRSAIFMAPLNVLLDDSNACVLTIKSIGNDQEFRKPDVSSSLIVTIGPTHWKIQNLDFYKDDSSSIRPELDVWSARVDLTTRRPGIPESCLSAPRGLIEWTEVRLEQPLLNPPLMVGLNLSVCRPSFHFPVNRGWPPERPDVTDNAADFGLEWPEEKFEFATTAGESSGVPQTGSVSEPAMEGNNGPQLWTWEAPLDTLWSDPRQPSHGLRDPLMDDIDELLA